jgi:hypothetical protein
MPSFTLADCAAHLADRVASKRRRLQEELDGLDAEAAKDQQGYDRAFLVGAMLAGEGFEPYVSRWSAGEVSVDVEMKDLPRLHALLGRLKAVNKRLANGKKNLISVTLEAVDWPGLEINYTKKLPKSEQQRCKIVRTKVKPRTEYQLVCEV